MVSAGLHGENFHHRQMGTVMTTYGRIGWRIAAVAAFVGTAALAVILSRVPARSGAALSSELTSRACATSGLEEKLGLGTPAGTGMLHTVGIYYTLEFTNISDRVCSLEGYPEVSAYAGSQAAGGPASGQIGGVAIRDTSVRPEPVTLAPGATAHSVLRVMTAGPVPARGCAQVTAEELRVTPPREDSPAFVPVHIPVCSGRGRASLSVQAIQARAGIPGHSIAPGP